MDAASGTVGATRLQDRFFLPQLHLGEGSFGTVWRGVDKISGESVAIKQLDKSALSTRGVGRDNVLQTAELINTCRHANVVSFIATFEDKRSLYLVIECCDAGCLADVVERRGVNINEGDAADWIAQICSAIGCLHGKNICHRNIRPASFMVKGGPTCRWLLKLTDFSLAVRLPQDGKLLRQRCGSPGFMAPEVCCLPKLSQPQPRIPTMRDAAKQISQNVRGYSLPADVWSIGMSMYVVMLGGRLPFVQDQDCFDERATLDVSHGNATTFLTSGMRFSEPAKQFCRRMLQLEPQKRPTVEQALQHPWLGEVSIHAQDMDAPASVKLHAAKSPMLQASIEAMSPSANNVGGVAMFTNSAPPAMATERHDSSNPRFDDSAKAFAHMQTVFGEELAELKRNSLVQYKQQQYLLEQIDRQQLELKCLRPRAKRAEALESENVRLQAEVQDLTLQSEKAQMVREKSVVARFEEELKHQHWKLQEQQRELEQHKITEAQLREAQVQLHEQEGHTKDLEAELLFKQHNLQQLQHELQLSLQHEHDRTAEVNRLRSKLQTRQHELEQMATRQQQSARTRGMRLPRLPRLGGCRWRRAPKRRDGTGLQIPMDGGCFPPQQQSQKPLQQQAGCRKDSTVKSTVASHHLEIGMIPPIPDTTDSSV